MVLNGGLTVNETTKKILAVIALFLLAGLVWFRLCGSCLYSDRSAADAARNSLQSAGQQATEAAGNLGSAEESVDEASRTADEIERGNQQLEEIGGDLADIIDQGKRIVAEIRRGKQTDTEETGTAA